MNLAEVVDCVLIPVDFTIYSMTNKKSLKSVSALAKLYDPFPRHSFLGGKSYFRPVIVLQ